MNLATGEPVHLAACPRVKIVSGYGSRMPDRQAAEPDGVSELPDDVERLVRRLVMGLGADVVTTVMARAPMIAGSDPCLKQQVDALERLRGCAHTRRAVVEWAEHYERTMAERAVRYGATQSDVGRALGLDRTTVTKRWPQLGTIATDRRWFESYAQDWARALIALADVADELHDMSPEAAVALGVAVRAARVFAVRGEWQDMATSAALDSVRVIAEHPHLHTPTARLQHALDDVAVAWRAYRAGRSPQAQRRSERRAGARETMRPGPALEE